MFADAAFAEHPFASRLETGAFLLGRAQITVALKAGAAVLQGTASLIANAEFRIFAATREFITRPRDAVTNQPFYGTLQKALRFERSIIGSTGLGELTSGVGEMDLINAAGEYDYLIQDYAIDGRRIVVKIGEVASGYDAFATIFDGTATGWSVEEDVLRITLRDYGYRLEVPAQANTYGGTGGVDGGADLKGKRKPRALGACAVVSPPLLDAATLLYQVNDGSVRDIPAVYSRAVALGRDADYATPAALMAATIPSGRYATCLAAGLFRVNFVLDGLITADVQGDATGGAYAATTTDIVRRLVAMATTIRDPDDLFLPAVNAVAHAQPATVCQWLGPDDELTVADVLGRLMGAIGGWAGFRRNGKFELGIVRAPTAPPEAYFDAVDIIEIDRAPLPSGIDPPPYRFRVAYERVWSEQTDFAGSVSSDRRSYLGQAVRLAEAADATIRADHPLAQDPAQVESYFTAQADAQAEANRLLALYGTPRALYRIVLKAQPFAIELGRVIHVTYDRWDLGAGKLLLVVALSEDSEENSVEIQAFG